jgi:galactose mutarotase-like enzyme
MRLTSPRWTLEVTPERGGRITSLRLDGEELLDQGIGIDQPDAIGFVEAGASGWDEMVPTIDPTGDLPDHGEAWRLPWTVLEEAGDSVAMSCSGQVVPWELERRIHLTGNSVRISYVYRNRGAVPHLAYWCAHPLFRYEEGMTIDAPGAEQLGQLEGGTSTKVFMPKGTIDRVALRWPSGRAVEIAWDAALTPYVGIWACNGDLGGYRHVAVEPATGGNDRPDPAAPPPLLAPGEELRWWMEVRAVRGRTGKREAG